MLRKKHTNFTIRNIKVIVFAFVLNVYVYPYTRNTAMSVPGNLFNAHNI